jgi:hypothetical protein
MTQDQKRMLSKTKREVLTAIATYRRQRRSGSGWIIGDKRVSASIVAQLEAQTLVREIAISGTPVLVVTEDGRRCIV